MRILLATEGIDEAGGVDTYLASVACGLLSRGHSVAALHHNSTAGSTSVQWPALERFCVDELGEAQAFAAAEAWRPGVCFSHNMNALAIDAGLVSRWPVVKMMHGYFGTCVSGQKSFGFPHREPCQRRIGAACLALYLPRGCGQRRPAVMLRQFAWAREQRTLYSRYSSIVVASEHMRSEFERSGAPSGSLRVVPLFAPVVRAATSDSAPGRAETPSVLFLGRMTPLKGGDLLIEAIAQASRRLSRPLRLTLGGDGPERERWQALAVRLGVDARFPGWLDAAGRDAAIRRATLVAVPSVWPEPFGLAGLEAASIGVPAVAFDVGGIREWLTDGVNGLLAPGSPPHASALADAIARALSDPSTLARLSDGARRKAAELTLDRHLDRLEPILLSACRHQALGNRHSAQ
jgi:glycosyltransferase involved in cell wall biosynthesis